MSQVVGYSVGEFLHANEDLLLGALTASVASTGVQTTRTAQIKSWKQQIKILKHAATRLINECAAFAAWYLVLEYELPRRQKRPDAILLAGDVILVIEFKVGANSFDASSRWQTEDYCLNLRDFHAESNGHPIVPILCATSSSAAANVFKSVVESVAPLQLANEKNLFSVILSAHQFVSQPDATVLIPDDWIRSGYRPTLSIIEAAERLYSNHGVREISHSYASNLDATTKMLARVIHDARTNGSRHVCFVTGVPGAGKTLTGLNVVHDPSLRAKGGPSGIFLSGNGPLVKVIREALVLSRQREGCRRQDCEHEVSTFIQNIHQFLRYHRENPAKVPHEHVVVFDEAQRAWDRRQMQRKQGVNSSEAAELFDVMDRLGGWAVIIALIGGGQEIFLGEAGLEEWGRAVGERSHWQVIASPEAVAGGASVAGHRLFKSEVPDEVVLQPELLAHLSVSVRSHRAQRLTEWVNAVLHQDIDLARNLMPDPREFPLYVTRSIDRARVWLREHSLAENNQRAGLVATSEDQRLRAYGLERSSAFRRGFSFDKWFLMPPTDSRSSHSLEVAASEFECQGLELDWVGLCWGGDLTIAYDGDWDYRKF
ncbi:MAG: DUF2075 domain-containing protein, partial [Proteobacteria bacterium]|nr:DUF2075 domain-containing protein [Pseudomonadota bacterium]